MSKPKGIADTIRAVVRAELVRGALQREIAHEAGMSEALMSRFLAGSRTLSQPMLEALCRVLRLELVQRGKPRRSKR